MLPDFLFLLPLRPPPNFTLFPYTTLFRSQIALWANSLSFEHPVRREPLSVESNPPKEFPWDLWNRFEPDRKSTRLNSSHVAISYAVFCLKKKTENNNNRVTDSLLIHI